MVRKRHNKIYFVLHQGNHLFIKTYLTRAENFRIVDNKINS